MFLHKIDENISLKLIELKDAEMIFKLIDDSRKYLREWLPWVDTTTKIEHTKGFIQSCLKGHVQNNTLQTVILVNGEIVGLAGYVLINRLNKTAYIGYWLGEKFQGNGIMTKVAKALTEYAFSELNLDKVEIRVATKNNKSKKIPERLGFVKEGCIRQVEWLYDHYVDHSVYGMLSKEWKGK